MDAPPDECLQTGGGILETGNDRFNILVLWVPDFGSIAGIRNHIAFRRGVKRGDVNIVTICNDCYGRMPHVVDDYEPDVYAIFDCVRESLSSSFLPAVAVLPK